MATLQLPLAVTAALLAMGSSAAQAAPHDPSAFIAQVTSEQDVPDTGVPAGEAPVGD